MTLRLCGDIGVLTTELRRLADDIEAGREGRIDCCTIALLGDRTRILALGPSYLSTEAERLFRTMLNDTAKILADREAA